jgi:hypothetical protein
VIQNGVNGLFPAVLPSGTFELMFNLRNDELRIYAASRILPAISPSCFSPPAGERAKLVA